MTNLLTFENEKELSLFIVHIKGMRKMQKHRDKLATKLSPSYPKFIKALEDAQIFEKQRDEIVKEIGHLIHFSFLQKINFLHISYRSF